MASLTTKSKEVLQMAKDNPTQWQSSPPIAANDDSSPRMVTLFRGYQEVAAVGAVDADDAAKQVAILVLQTEGGLRLGDEIRITRI